MDAIFRRSNREVFVRETSYYHVDDAAGIIGIIFPFFISGRFMPRTVWPFLIVTTRAILLPIQEPFQFPFQGKLMQDSFELAAL